MIYLELFLSFMKIGLLSFGGGYAALPFINEEVVHLKNWLSPTEFTDLLSISQMTPGPIAINAATFVGLQKGGIPGAIVATLGNITPCIVIVLILSWLYRKYSDVDFTKKVLFGVRPAVVALISSAGISIFLNALWNEGSIGDFKKIDFVAVALFLVALLAYRKLKKVDPIVIMLTMGALGGILYYLVFPIT